MSKRHSITAKISASVAASLIAIGAAAAPTAHTPDYYGAPAQSSNPDQTVELTPQTRWINVSNDATVTFRSGQSAFSWHFDTFHGEDHFNLGEIAPQGFEAGQVRVFVTPSPTRLGS